jgi:hypothetical protein
VSTLLDLADCCEKAIGADRELDALIMATLFRREKRLIGTREEMDDGSWRHIKTGVWVDQATDEWVSTAAREFTSSIDAAMTLVPQGFAVELSEAWGPGRKDWRATMKRRSIDGAGTWPKANSDKPALALCAAALRARASAGTAEGQS